MKKYLINNLDCVNCAIELENELKKKKYIKYVNINYATNSMLVDTDDLNKLKKDIFEFNKSFYLSENVVDISFEKEKNFLIFSGVIYFIAFIVMLMQKYLYFDYDLYIFYDPLFIIVYILSGLYYLIKAYNSVINKNFFDENVLMTISTIAAFLLGYFEEASSVMLFYSIGQYFLKKAKYECEKKIEKLNIFNNEKQQVYINNNFVSVNVEDLKKGDKVLLKSGQMLLFDAKILEKAVFDTKYLNGELEPVELEKDDVAKAFSILIDKSLIVSVKEKYSESLVYKLNQSIVQSFYKKSKKQEYITNFSNMYTPIMIMFALLISFLPPIFLRYIDFSRSIYMGLIFLIIACPCAFVLNIPFLYAVVLSDLFEKNIIIKDIDVFERLNEVDSLYIDKTGTLTNGFLNLEKEKMIIDYKDYIYSGVMKSDHIYSNALKNHLKNCKIYDVSVNNISSMGLVYNINNDEILVGNEKLMQKYGVFLDEHEYNIYVSVNKKIVHMFKFKDHLKDETYGFFEKIRKLGVDKIKVLTGSKEDDYINSVDVKYNLSIEEKEKYVENEKCIFVGDGINDILAMLKSYVSICISKNANDISKLSSDVIINKGDLNLIIYLKKISKKMKYIMYENMILIIFVKFIVMFFGIFFKGKLWTAVLADVGVAIISIVNILRIKVKKNNDN